MSEKNLMICDREILFAERLGENVSSRSEFAVKVYTCTSVENVLLFQKRKRIHILIIDEKFLAGERMQIAAEQVFVLTKDCCRDLQQEEKEVYKYQSADGILSQVFDFYFDKNGENILRSVRKEKCRLVAVYSPIHRIGKTTFALTLAKGLAAKKKVLYLNMEEYPDIGERFENTTAESYGRNLGDLVYFMKQEEKNFTMRLSNMVRKMEELDYISPIPMCRDLKEVASSDWKLLLEKILKESKYETIILDLSESVQGLYEILQMCEKIYMPILEDAISASKIHHFENDVKQLQISEILENTYQFIAAEDDGINGMKECARKLVREEW